MSSYMYYRFWCRDEPTSWKQWERQKKEWKNNTRYYEANSGSQQAQNGTDDDDPIMGNAEPEAAPDDAAACASMFEMPPPTRITAP